MSDTGTTGDTFVAVGVFLDADGQPLDRVTFTPSGQAPVVVTPDDAGRVQVELPLASDDVDDIKVTAGDRSTSLLAPGAPLEGGAALDLNDTLPDVAPPAVAAPGLAELAAAVADLQRRLAVLEK